MTNSYFILLKLLEKFNDKHDEHGRFAAEDEDDINETYNDARKQLSEDQKNEKQALIDAQSKELKLSPAKQRAYNEERKALPEHKKADPLWAVRQQQIHAADPGLGMKHAQQTAALESKHLKQQVNLAIRFGAIK